MHKYLFDSSRKRDTSLRHVESSSRREVVFQVPQKRKKLSSSRLSLVLILTSSQPGSSQELHSSLPPLAISAEDFYMKPKSLLEQQYERKVNEFVSRTNDDFVQLDSSPVPEKQEDHNAPFDSVIEVPSQQEEPVVLPHITPDLVNKNLQDGSLQAGLLLHNAEYFLDLAQSIVLQCNDLAGSELYFSYIKLALTFLHILLNRYQSSLNPQLELAIKFKLAEIYFTETENLGRAQKFVMASLAVSSRHNLDMQYIASDLLHYRILLAKRDSTLPTYFKDRIAFYSSKKLFGALDVFSLLRAQWCLHNDPDLALNHLRALNQSSSTEPQVQILSLLLEASLHTYRGNPLESKPLLKASAAKMSVLGGPPQLRGLHLLLTLIYYINVGDFQKGKDTTKELSKFIGRQKRSNWEVWSANGQVSCNIKITTKEQVELQMSIFSSEEFVILFYFLSGVLLTSSESSYSKAEKVFDTCLQAIDLRLQTLASQMSHISGFSIRHLSEIIIRLNCIRYSLLYYRTWLQIVSNEDYSGMALIREFLKNYNTDTFSDEELSCYKSVLDRFIYLNALYHLSEGDMQGAKYYFMQVRNSTSHANIQEDEPPKHSNQIDFNIGCEMLLGKDDHNELHLYSSLHLLLICEYEMYLFSNNPNFAKIEHTNVYLCRSFLSTLYSGLHPVMNQGGSSGIGKSEKWLRFTFKIVSLVIQNKDLSTSSPAIKEITEHHLLKDVNCPTYLKDLSLYLRYQTSTKREEKELLAKQLSNSSSKAALLNLLRVLVLSDVNRSDDQEYTDLQILNFTNLLKKYSAPFQVAHLSFKV